jgi:hypothetical protein
MPAAGDFTLLGKRAVLATMHGKERALRPLLHGALGLDVHLPAGLDTDRFGTFSREIARTGSQLYAARAKIAAGFELDREASVAIASEGGFGPHPALPFAALGREIVVLLDRSTGLELVGRHDDLQPVFAHAAADGPEAALAFAARIGFPAQGLIVIGLVNGVPDPAAYLRKDIGTPEALAAAVRAAVTRCGGAHLETDMRAHRNPNRMRAIRRAGIDLVRRYRSLCPSCARPGFAVTGHVAGLPCSWCGSPTHATRARASVCAGCGWRVEQAVAAPTADPGECEYCNP